MATMERDVLLTNLGAAEAVLRVYPSSPAPRPTTERAYARLAERWHEGERFEEFRPGTRTFVGAALRRDALKRLREAADGLRTCLGSGPADEAARQAREVAGCIEVLERLAPERRGRRARASEALAAEAGA